MATIDGARAMGLEQQIGSIERGKKADLVAFDFRRPHLTPSINPLGNLVHVAQGRDVEVVLVDGRVVVLGGEPTTAKTEAYLPMHGPPKPAAARGRVVPGIRGRRAQWRRCEEALQRGSRGARKFPPAILVRRSPPGPKITRCTWRAKRIRESTIGMLPAARDDVQDRHYLDRR
jgi:hypothetical protein